MYEIKTDTAVWYNVAQKAYTIDRIDKLDFPWKLQLPRSRCILGELRPPESLHLGGPPSSNTLNLGGFVLKPLRLEAAPPKLCSGFAI